ncbi:MAG: phosphotransferase family protein [Erysipelothrix sp.]|nr:phosphotransferase family protein [Erysipelothrix sp.]
MKINIPYKYKFIKDLELGLTNKNYLLEIDAKKYICRLPLNDLDIFNRNNEKKIIQALRDSNFTIPVSYYDNGIQLSPYLNNLVNYADYNDDQKIFKVAELMKKLHQTKVDDIQAFNPIEMIYKYASLIEDLEIDLNDFTYLFEAYSKHTYVPSLCHNDWVDGNICFIADQAYLIDFEYAGLNDPLFDIMSFITENDLSSKVRRDFLLAMLDEPDAKTLLALEMYRDINNLLWYLWADMMFKKRHESIYNKIKAIKYQQLYSEMKKPLNFI